MPNTNNYAQVWEPKKINAPPKKGVWRRRWDSNPRYREVQLISSQSRYDHFDTSPYAAPY